VSGGSGRNGPGFLVSGWGPQNLTVRFVRGRTVDVLGTGSLCPHGDVVMLTEAAVVAALGQRRLSPDEHSTEWKRAARGVSRDGPWHEILLTTPLFHGGE
jgi:hypothetical protein